MKNIEEAIEIIKKGGIVIFPTDTAFGIGCRIDNKNSIKRLFEIRKRPLNQATPVLFDSIERVRQYISHFDLETEKLMRKYWPGALTLVLPCKIERVPELVRGGGNNLGVRIPNHQVPIELIKALDVPILGPSANFHGEPTPYTFEGLDKDLIKLVDFVVKGKTEGANLASTVVDCTTSPYRIIRQGAITL